MWIRDFSHKFCFLFFGHAYWDVLKVFYILLIRPNLTHKESKYRLALLWPRYWQSRSSSRAISLRNGACLGAYLGGGIFRRGHCAIAPPPFPLRHQLRCFFSHFLKQCYRLQRWQPNTYSDSSHTCSGDGGGRGQGPPDWNGTNGRTVTKNLLFPQF